MIGRGQSGGTPAPGNPFASPVRAKRSGGPTETVFSTIARRGIAKMTKHTTTLTKADLIEEVLNITELPRKESETIVETIFDSIIGALQKGEKIEIRGFGSFRTRERRGRVGRNPQTGGKVEVPAKNITLLNHSA